MDLAPSDPDTLHVDEAVALVGRWLTAATSAETAVAVTQIVVAAESPTAEPTQTRLQIAGRSNPRRHRLLLHRRVVHVS